MQPIFDDSRDDPTHERVKILLRIDDKKADEICSYNEVTEQLYSHFEKEFTQDSDTMWKFRTIKDHKGPLSSQNKEYKGSKYNVLVEWEYSDVTWEPLNLIAQADLAACAIYARDHKLLNTEGWKQFKQLAKKQKRMIRAINQSKLIQVRRSMRFKFGYQVPRTYDKAIELDNKNGNTL